VVLLSDQHRAAWCRRLADQAFALALIHGIGSGSTASTPLTGARHRAGGVGGFIRSLSRALCRANITIRTRKCAGIVGARDCARASAANTLCSMAPAALDHTDVEGFRNLDDCRAGLGEAGGEAVLLGAGGSARAVVYGLIERARLKIKVVNRTIDRAHELRRRFGDAGSRPRLDRAARSARPLWLPVNNHVARHDRPAAACNRSGVGPAMHRHRSGLMPRQNIVTRGRGGARLAVADALECAASAVRGFELWFGSARG